MGYRSPTSTTWYQHLKFQTQIQNPPPKSSCRFNSPNISCHLHFLLTNCSLIFFTYVLFTATQEEAATAYDMAAIEYRGLNAVTNFDLSRYIKWLRPNNQNNPSNPQEKPNGDVNPIPNPKHELELSFTSHQESSSVMETAVPPTRPSASSALGLLLQSSKFKEMLERTSANDCPLTPQEPDQPRRSFPDDIQTYFDCQDSGTYAEGDDIIFGDLNSLSSPIFHCELDG